MKLSEFIRESKKYEQRVKNPQARTIRFVMHGDGFEKFRWEFKQIVTVHLGRSKWGIGELKRTVKYSNIPKNVTIFTYKTQRQIEIYRRARDLPCAMGQGQYPGPRFFAAIMGMFIPGAITSADSWGFIKAQRLFSAYRPGAKFNIYDALQSATDNNLWSEDENQGKPWSANRNRPHDVNASIRRAPDNDSIQRSDNRNYPIFSFYANKQFNLNKTIYK